MTTALDAIVSRLPPSKCGRRASPAELSQLHDAMPHIPEWYLTLLGRWPLSGSQLQLNMTYDKHVAIEWASPSDITQEAFDAIPGIFIRDLGYVPVGLCPEGSGNPFFTRFENDDPELIQVYHDAVSPDGAFGLNSTRRIAASLTSFFERVNVIV